jgi:hypothetical protein
VSRHRTYNRILWPALSATIAVFSAALAFSPAAAAKWAGAEPCMSSNGLTLKQRYSYSFAIVTPECNEIPVGERWAPSVPWIVNAQFAQKPSGFVTNYATPLDDLRAKLKRIEVTVDAGTPYEATRGYPADNRLWTGQLPDAPGLPAINTVTLGAQDALALGRHVVEVRWEFAEPHCDGFTADQGTSCLPAGRTLVKRIGFTVVDPYADKSGGQSG